MQATFDVTLAARSGTSWQRLGQDVHGELAAYAQSGTRSGSGQADLKGHFDVVVTVLGTNDIPKTSAMSKTWHKLEDVPPVVLTSLKAYLKPEASSGGIIVTQPFNFEPD
jgi:hypothetical protein